MKKYLYIFILSILFLNTATLILAQTKLKVCWIVSSRSVRKTLDQIINEFHKKHPQIKIIFIGTSNEQYHKNFKNWILNTNNNNIDVMLWFIGFRFNQYMRHGLIEPIDNLWKNNNLFQSFPHFSKTVSFKNNIYALPISYYQWGFYYNAHLFYKYNLKPPKTWKQFLKVCEVLKKNNIIPISIGTKNNWPAASWFSYLNLRINGLNFHKKLMAGKISYKDKRIRSIFQHWKLLIDKKYFLKDRSITTYKYSLAFLYRDLAAMTLIGNFAKTYFPKNLKYNIRFFKFPKISNQPYYEEAPTDILFIRKNSKNKQAAIKFLKFISSPEILYKFNHSAGFISTNVYSKKSDDYYINEGMKTLRNASGFSQYFDRDTPEKMGYGGFKIFSDFMKDANIDRAINSLEKLRKNSYN